jgi:flagellar basal-body rod modification protein FlgD
MDMTSALTASSQQDFYMKLLMAQLQNQDPTEPMSNSEMVTQLAQLTTLDVMNNLNATFEEVLKLQTLMNGTQLLGKSVEYELGGLPLAGTIESVLSNNGSILLVVDGVQIGLGNVTKILSE